MPFTPLQIREVFHLLFLQEFLRKFDPKLVVLKGGVNLRLFFQSPRYSEDMDLDVQTASVESVRKNVLRTLEALSVPMKVYGVSQVVAPKMQSAKQTETTQRFKIHLHTTGGLDLFTKVEFSRRGGREGYRFARVDENLSRTYRMAPVLVQHYGAEAAFEQKIRALAGRVQVQSRDIFDLYRLLPFLPASWTTSVDGITREKAADRALEISYLEYREAVVAYLGEEDQKLYGLEEVWREMQGTVVKTLREKGLHE
ncbi:MAG: nucleotidyl transferase AbiEii/AbiGii toxin family protein [Deltaproteobacteria bacterium]|nr:nucleotidyl transferase AbiEii/AbiGii toxin family protein [Deltaproteobacteria bacterium]